ncbi:hypothetical protein BE08_23985 [Sorangium cellulosum]|uniref:Uncharacterized protein n=1 Tax=Sorangium cellulosum TaxID=56 RepID=A0A150PDA2_SORCE|nr:hypothetical protein BE08_23985 [Sorangium cellulosum]
MRKQVKITLRHGTPAEVGVQRLLSELLAKYDLTDWIFTEDVLVDEDAFPHSHPVLTLGTGNGSDELLCLAELVHEQLHWFEEERAEARDRAIEATVLHWPEVPSARPEGAGSESSTRLHLLVCYLEYQAMKLLVGERAARQTMTALAGHHYRWVYRTVLSEEQTIGALVARHGLLPEPLLQRGVARREEG